MPLDTVQNLRQTIKRRLHRSDVDDALVDDFIAQTESEIYGNEVNILRVREMDTRATATTSSTSRFLALPDNFLAMRRLSLLLDSGSTPDVKFNAPEQMIIRPAGRPRFFTVTSQLEFDRVPDSAYDIEMQYYMSATPLSDDSPTNFVLTNYPNIYLYGSLSAAFEFAVSPDMVDYYKRKFVSAIAGANKGTKKGAYGPAPSMRQDYGSTP